MPRTRYIVNYRDAIEFRRPDQQSLGERLFYFRYVRLHFAI